jgi:hypothetical protein
MATNPNPTGFLTAVARIHLSHLFRDPFVAAAFRAAEDDGLAPSLVVVDQPPALTGGSAEPVLAMLKPMKKAKAKKALIDVAKLPAGEEVLILLYEAYRAMDQALQAIYNRPRSVGAHGPIDDEQERARDRAIAIAAKLSQLTSIRSFWTGIYQEIMVSHCYYTGGDGDDAVRALAKAMLVPVDD